MQLRPDLAINAMIKSLSDVVLPAVDEDDAPAREQLQIAIGLLSLLASRLPLEFEYDCDELKRLIELADDLIPYAGGSKSAESVLAKVVSAKQVLQQAQSAPAEVQDSIRALRSATGVLISASYTDLEDSARNALTRTVLAHADAQLIRERAWLLPQGWESRTDGVPDVRSLIRAVTPK